MQRNMYIAISNVKAELCTSGNGCTCLPTYVELHRVLFQSNFDCHLKTVCEMTEVGETVARVDTLIREGTAFQKLCTVSPFIPFRRSALPISVGPLKSKRMERDI